MDWLPALGAALALAGLAGYLAGLTVDYPGRAFSLTAVMIGITVFLVGRGESERSAFEDRGAS